MEEHMKAAVSSDQGLQIKDIPQPKPKPFEILVRVRAASQVSNVSVADT